MMAGQLGSESRGGSELAPGSYLVGCPSRAPGCEPPLGLSPWAFQTQVFGVELLLGDLKIGKTQRRGLR